MLDFLHFVTLIGAVQGIFFGLVLLGLPRGNRLANRMLALFMTLERYLPYFEHSIGAKNSDGTTWALWVSLFC